LNLNGPKWGPKSNTICCSWLLLVSKSNLLLVFILIRTYPLYALPSHFFKIHFNSILPSTSRSSRLFFSLRLLHQNHLCTSALLRMCHMTRFAVYETSCFVILFIKGFHLLSSFTAWVYLYFTLSYSISQGSISV